MLRSLLFFTGLAWLGCVAKSVAHVKRDRAAEFIDFA